MNPDRRRRPAVKIGREHLDAPGLMTLPLDAYAWLVRFALATCETGWRAESLAFASFRTYVSADDARRLADILIAAGYLGAGEDGSIALLPSAQVSLHETSAKRMAKLRQNRPGSGVTSQFPGSDVTVVTSQLGHCDVTTGPESQDVTSQQGGCDVTSPPHTPPEELNTKTPLPPTAPGESARGVPGNLPGEGKAEAAVDSQGNTPAEVEAAVEAFTRVFGAGGGFPREARRLCRYYPARWVVECAEMAEVGGWAHKGMGYVQGILKRWRAEGASDAERAKARPAAKPRRQDDTPAYLLPPKPNGSEPMPMSWDERTRLYNLRHYGTEKAPPPPPKREAPKPVVLSAEEVDRRKAAQLAALRGIAPPNAGAVTG